MENRRYIKCTICFKRCANLNWIAVYIAKISVSPFLIFHAISIKICGFQKKGGFDQTLGVGMVITNLIHVLTAHVHFTIFCLCSTCGWQTI